MQDTEIIELYWARSERAIPATSERYGSYCTVIAWNILRSREDAEECVNDTWLNAWNAMPPHRPSVLSAFLGKLTRNLAIDRYQRNTAEKRGGGEVPAILDELSECVSGSEDVEGSVERQEVLAAINAFLRQLPERNRQLFLCRYWYSDSVANIAERFGMKENAVSKSLGRTRAALREHLKKGGFDL